MADLARRPAGLTRDELGRHCARAFVSARCSVGSTLVVPLWTVWKEYEAFAERSGVEARAIDLRRLLDEAPWAQVVERPQARGRLKTIVRGMGLLPTAPR